MMAHDPAALRRGISEHLNPSLSRLVGPHKELLRKLTKLGVEFSKLTLKGRILAEPPARAAKALTRVITWNILENDAGDIKATFTLGPFHLSLSLLSLL